MAEEFEDTTIYLDRIRQGSSEAKEMLITSLYDRWRSRARRQLTQERGDNAFTASDLTNEALARMIRNDEIERAANGSQLYWAFTRAMRQILIDHARRRESRKHGQGWRRQELDELVDYVVYVADADILALDEALTILGDEHPRAGKVLALRFFGGCELKEIAASLETSLSTVERDVRFGLACLREHLATD